MRLMVSAFDGAGLLTSYRLNIWCVLCQVITSYHFLPGLIVCQTNAVESLDL
jgi:hypothetical protein